MLHVFLYAFLVFFSPVSAEKLKSLRLFNLDSRNEAFVGRRNHLENIKQTLNKNHTAIISGLPGIGKTQLAKEYAYRYAKKYRLIWWFNGQISIEAQIDRLLKKLSKESGLQYFRPLNEKSYLEQLGYFVSSTQGSWLLIFDNYEKPVDEMNCVFEERQKRGEPIDVIITSHNWEGPKMIPVHPFERKESIEFLSRFLKEEPLEKKERLAELLGDYPLALAQASSFIASNPSIDIDEYIRIFHENKKELWEAEKRVVEQEKSANISKDNYKKTLSNTLNITLNSLKNENPLAFDMIKFASFLSHKHVPEELLKTWALNVKKVTRVQFHEALTKLSNYSLLVQETKNSGLKEDVFYSQYELIQELIKDDLSEDERFNNLEAASEAILGSLTHVKGTFDEQFLGREYYGDHLEAICQSAKYSWKNSPRLIETKIAYLYYIHCIRRDFEESSLLIKELSPQRDNQEISGLSRLWLYVVLVNNEVFGEINAVRNYRDAALKILPEIKDPAERGGYEVILTTDFIFSLLNFGFTNEAYELKEEVKKTLNELGNKKIKGICLLDLSTASSQREEYENALKELNESEKIIKQFEECSSYIPMIKVRQAECLLMLKEYEKAMNLIKEAEEGLSQTFASSENHFSIRAKLIKAKALICTGHLKEAREIVVPIIEQYEASANFEHDVLKGRMHVILGQIYDVLVRT
ncbi:MAG: hypothetical protein ACP5OE_09015 [Thermodesulfobium sp.]